MKHLKSMLLVLALLTPLSALADKVTCESKKDALKECEMDTRGGVRMVKQLSRADCVEGHDWGVNRYSVWVKNGCRAEFETGGGSGYGGGYGGGSGNAGRGDWDRGCSDAKAGSYDRSGNASRAYEDGWQACKRQGNSYGNQSSSEVSGAAKSACMAAVNRKHDGRVRDLYVVSSEFSQANSEVIVNADGERWRCLVSNNGSRVEDLSLQRGSSSSNNTGRDWDRGCADAKAGSYDRSGNASRAYEDGWQACKNQNRPSGNQGSAEVPSAAKSACLTAVNKNHGGAVVTLFVDSAEFSQANSVVIVNADGERWRCLVSNNGSRVEDLRRQY